MTNDTQHANRTTSAARRTGRALTIVTGTAGALALWAVDVPWAGIELTVGRGESLGPGAVVVTALIAGLAAWALLAVLERTVTRPVRAYRIVALAVLVISLAGPLGSGGGLSSTMSLIGLHLTVGLALILGLPRHHHCP